MKVVSRRTGCIKYKKLRPDRVAFVDSYFPGDQVRGRIHQNDARNPGRIVRKVAHPRQVIRKLAPYLGPKGNRHGAAIGSEETEPAARRDPGFRVDKDQARRKALADGDLR